MTRESVDLGALPLPEPWSRQDCPADHSGLPFAPLPGQLVPLFLPLGGKRLSRQTSSTHGPDGYITTDPAVIDGEILRMQEKLAVAIGDFTYYEYDGAEGDTLLLLNNFNYGMTGGQCSATTPNTGLTSSGFLSELEAPLDICRVAVAAGASYVDRTLATGKELGDRLAAALRYPGFSLIDIWGLCPGRYTKKNRLTLAQLAQGINDSGVTAGPVAGLEREEYAAHYRRLASGSPAAAEPLRVAVVCDAPTRQRCDVLLLGSAGQYINTAGEILCLAGMSGGLHVSQKNDYPITVLRGHSIAEVVLDRRPIDYTGIGTPALILCVAAEGVARRRQVFSTLGDEAVVVKDSTLTVPKTRARVVDLDFAGLNIRSSERALAALAVVAGEGVLLTGEMLAAGITHRYRGKMRDEALALAARVLGW